MTDTVLVADDSKTIRQIVEMALKASSWEVVGVDNAQDAVQAARQNPNVILLDYYMPDGSGYDVCRALKSDAQTSSIPIVMLGGTYKNFDESLARQAGADEVLMKPFKTDALIEALESAQKNGAAAAPPQAETGYEAPSPEPEPVYEAPSSEPEPVYEPPTSEPEPQRQAPQKTPAKSPLPRPRSQAERSQADRANDQTPMPSSGSSQPRIPSEPARSASTASEATSGSTPGTQTQTPTPSAGSAAGAGGISRSEIEALVKEEVKAAVRAELPALLRNVMGEIFQQKVLPKLMEHAEARIKSVVNKNLSGQIQNQVRVELERLLEE